jgi:ElaB/YqjD/DUF883 family membrane-anchored ribosome-binding protein
MGDRREEIVHDDTDRSRFVETLEDVVEPSGWLAERLHMGARNAVSRIVRQARERTKGNRKVKRIAKRIKEMVNPL